MRTQGTTNKRYEYNGKEYALRELAKLSDGLPSRVIATRVAHGWSVKEAVEMPLLGKGNKRTDKQRKYSCVVDGKMMGVTQLSSHIGLPVDTIYHRLNRGATLQEVADNPTKQTAREHEYQGKLYTVKELEIMVGCPASFIRKRLREGLTMEEIALRYGKGKHSRRGRLYQYQDRLITLREASKLSECVVSLATIRTRIYNGWDLEKAVCTKAMK